MQTIQTAKRIFENNPGQALNDAIGVAAMVGLVLAGFLAPVIF